MNTKQAISAILVLWAAAGMSSLCLAEEIEAEGIRAFTRPSKDPMLSFVRAGQIAEVLVKKGERVQAGQLLARQDDAAEQIQLAQLKARAEDTTRIQARQADLDVKKTDLEAIKEISARGSTTEREVRLAELEVVIAGLTKSLAEFDHRQDQKACEEARIQLDRMKITSPIGGTVEEILVEEGESVDSLADVIRVVKIDPLEIDVDVPQAQAMSLRPGQRARVRFEVSPSGPVNGHIIHVPAVGNAGGNTRKVTVELPNPKGRPAGEWVRVSFSEEEQSSEDIEGELEPSDTEMSEDLSELRSD